MKDGQYYYAPHRRMWGVWKYQDLGKGFSSGVFVNDFPTREDARMEVRRLNGWIKN